MNRPAKSDRYTWPVAGVLMVLVVYTGMAQLDRADAAGRKHIAKAVAAQKAAIKLERAAQAACEDSHGPGAAHWWDGGVLVCARASRDVEVAAK